MISKRCEDQTATSTTPGISVIIPTYNRRTELLRAIDSVLAQTVPVDEIIVVDDGSEFPVARLLTEHYGPSVRVITNGTNMGGAASRNIGVNAARHAYVAFLDSDDYWEREKIAEQKVILSTRPEVDLVYCNEWMVSRDGSHFVRKQRLLDEGLWDGLLDGWTAPNTSTLLFRRAFLLGLEGFDSRLPSCQDHDLWMRLARARGRVAYVPKCLCHFTMGASGRISYNGRARVQGMSLFLRKWKSAITESRGERFYTQFRNEYWRKVMLPVCQGLVTQGNLPQALFLYIRYLMFNPAFYRHAWKRLWFHWEGLRRGKRI